VRCDLLLRRENVLLLSNSGTGENPPCVAARLGCLLSCAFHNGGGNVHELTDAKNEKRLLRFQKQMASYELLIVDELGSCHYRTQASNCSSRSSATSGD
jgi:DNA replication protein DnaC